MPPDDPIDPLTGRSVLPGTTPLPPGMAYPQVTDIGRLLTTVGSAPPVEPTNEAYKTWLAGLKPDISGFTAPDNPMAPLLKSVRQQAPALDVWKPEGFGAGTAGEMETDLWRAFTHGLGESPMGALKRYGQMRATIGWDNDPEYDPWKDPAIRREGFRDQMHLFTGRPRRP